MTFSLSAPLRVAFDTHLARIRTSRDRNISRLALRSEVECASQDARVAASNTRTQGTKRPVADGDAESEADSALGQRAEQFRTDAVVGLGERLDTDEFQGDTNHRTMERLLATVDSRGFERSSQQLQFHAAFAVATARVVWKDDWAMNKPKIMQKMGWNEAFSEVCISTPRRFGKTFRCSSTAHAHLETPLTCTLTTSRAHAASRYTRRAWHSRLEWRLSYSRLLGGLLARSLNASRSSFVC